MKKIIKKLSLILTIISITMPYMVFAEENNTSENNTSENTTSGVVENTTSEVVETPTKSNDASLKELRIEGLDLNRTFSSTVLEYTATVKSDVTSVTIIANVNDSKAKIKDGSTGLKNLTVGVNTYTIPVTAEDGSEVTYTLKITRATSDLNLTKLNIQGQKLNETFDPSVTEYTADVTYNVTSITVQNGKPDGTTVTIDGSANLNVGKNTVSVKVTNAAGEEKVYTIIVTRGTEEELNGTSDDNTSDESDTTSDEEIISSSASEDTIIFDEKPGSDDTLQYIIVVISCVLLLAIAILGIVFFVRSGDSEKKRQKKIAKLKKKQGKIEEQLTGLMPVITEADEQEYLNTKKNEPVKPEIVEEETVAEDEEESFNTEEVDLDDTIEIEPIKEEKPRRRVDRDIDDDFDDLFLDE